jgi:hypothetical protein
VAALEPAGEPVLVRSRAWVRVWVLARARVVVRALALVVVLALLLQKVRGPTGVRVLRRMLLQA